MGIHQDANVKMQSTLWGMKRVEARCNSEVWRWGCRRVERIEPMIEHGWLYRKKAVRGDTHSFLPLARRCLSLPEGSCSLSTLGQKCEPLLKKPPSDKPLSNYTGKKFRRCTKECVIESPKDPESRNAVISYWGDEKLNHNVISKTDKIKKKDAHHQLGKNVEQPDPEDTTGEKQWDGPLETHLTVCVSQRCIVLAQAVLRLGFRVREIRT